MSSSATFGGRRQPVSSAEIISPARPLTAVRLGPLTCFCSCTPARAAASTMVDGSTEFFPAEEVFDGGSSVSSAKQSKVPALEGVVIAQQRELEERLLSAADADVRETPVTHAPKEQKQQQQPSKVIQEATNLLTKQNLQASSTTTGAGQLAAPPRPEKVKPTEAKLGDQPLVEEKAAAAKPVQAPKAEVKSIMASTPGVELPPQPAGEKRPSRGRRVLIFFLRCLFCGLLTAALFALGSGTVSIPASAHLTKPAQALQTQFRSLWHQSRLHVPLVQFVAALSFVLALSVTLFLTCLCSCCRGRASKAREPIDDELALPAPYRPLTG